MARSSVTKHEVRQVPTPACLLQHRSGRKRPAEAAAQANPASSLASRDRSASGRTAGGNTKAASEAPRWNASAKLAPKPLALRLGPSERPAPRLFANSRVPAAPAGAARKGPAAGPQQAARHCGETHPQGSEAQVEGPAAARPAEVDSAATGQAAVAGTAASALLKATAHSDTAAVQQRSVQKESGRSTSPALGERLAIISLPVTTGRHDVTKTSSWSVSHCCAPR